MIADLGRVHAGSPAGGQFTSTARLETGPTLTDTQLDLTAFGPHTCHVRELLDRVAAMNDGEREALAANAPTVVDADGDTQEVFCPAADASRYHGLTRYRRLARVPQTSAVSTDLAAEVARGLAAADVVAAGLPPASVEAVRDAVSAMVLRGRTHAIAYETLTRAVRQALGRIHPDDGPLHR